MPSFCTIYSPTAVFLLGLARSTILSRPFLALNADQNSAGVGHGVVTPSFRRSLAFNKRRRLISSTNKACNKQRGCKQGLVKSKKKSVMRAQEVSGPVKVPTSDICAKEDAVALETRVVDLPFKTSMCDSALTYDSILEASRVEYCWTYQAPFQNLKDVPEAEVVFPNAGVDMVWPIFLATCAGTSVVPWAAIFASRSRI